MEVMICHWDGYCLGRNNFRIYHNPETDRTVFLPSGMDQCFAKFDLPWKPDMAGLVARSVMAIPEGRQQYEARFRALFHSIFLAERLTNRANQLLTQLSPLLKRSERETMRREAARLAEQIVERERYLREQLNAPELRAPQFNHGLTVVTGWKRAGELGAGTMQECNQADGIRTLHIVAGPRTSASWRATVRLGPGQYMFRGRAKATKVTSLPFGKNHGGLRVGGKCNSRWSWLAPLAGNYSPRLSR
jgi:hypothetical protein